jgi:hypothetical protein
MSQGHLRRRLPRQALVTALPGDALRQEPAGERDRAGRLAALVHGLSLAADAVCPVRAAPTRRMENTMTCEEKRGGPSAVAVRGRVRHRDHQSVIGSCAGATPRSTKVAVSRGRPHGHMAYHDGAAPQEEVVAL